MNHFEIFGLAPSVDLDVKALEQQHRALSLTHHPDRVTQADARTRRLALEKTTALNDALKVLKDPVRRAFHVLALQGVDLEREDVAGRAPMPMAFLEEVLERREALEAAMHTRDVAKARAMADQVAAELARALAQAQAALRAGDVATATHQLGRVRYFTRFVEEVEAFEEEVLS
jgi:molecular chaperone HscB